MLRNHLIPTKSGFRTSPPTFKKHQPQTILVKRQSKRYSGALISTHFLQSSGEQLEKRRRNEHCAKNVFIKTIASLSCDPNQRLESTRSRRRLWDTWPSKTAPASTNTTLRWVFLTAQAPRSGKQQKNKAAMNKLRCRAGQSVLRNSKQKRGKIEGTSITWWNKTVECCAVAPLHL